MNSNLTMTDFFSLLLFILGIGALVFLILALKNISNVFLKINKLIDNNTKELDKTIKQLPDITENINVITKSTKRTIEDLSPEINRVVKNINNISTNVDNTTDKLGQTFEDVCDTISDASILIKHNTKNITVYISVIKEVLEIIKKQLSKI